MLRWTLLAGERNGNMPKKDISNKKSKRRSGVGKEKKKKAKKAQLMSQEEMMGAKKDALIQYQADFPHIFPANIDFSVKISDLRFKFWGLQIAHEAVAETSSDDDDEEDDDEEDEDDDDGDDSDDSGDRKRTPAARHSPSPTRMTPPRSGKNSATKSAAKSPSVVDSDALQALVGQQLSVDGIKIATSCQKLASRFVRGGNQNLKAVTQLMIGDLVAIPDADFSRARSDIGEVTLFKSYHMYFYTVVGLPPEKVSLEYAFRSEPLDNKSRPEFTTPLDLELAPRTCFDLPILRGCRWIIATAKGQPALRKLYPVDSSSSSGGGGKDNSNHDSRRESGGGSGRSSSSNSSSNRGSNSSSSSNNGRSDSTKDSRRGSSSSGGRRHSGTVTFNDNILGGVELVQELPFVGSVRPPDEAAVETMFWRPYGAGKPVSSTTTVGSQLPMFCPQTQVEFIYANASRCSSKEAVDFDQKMAETIIPRQLANPNPDYLGTYFTGKGTDIRPVTEIHAFLANRTVSVKNQSIMQNKSTGDSALVIWDQLRFDISVYNQVSTAEAYRDAALFDRYFKHGFTAKVTDDWTLDATSPRLANFVARSLHFSPDIEVSTASELLYQKGVLASAIHHLEMFESLNRHPFVFLQAFKPIQEALTDPSHEVCNHVYTIPALVWLFELSLARFYRHIRHHRGAPDVVAFRRILWELVVSPFVNISQQVQIAYNLSQQSAHLKQLETAQKRLKSATVEQKSTQAETPIPSKSGSRPAGVITNISPPKISTVPPDRLVCKYHLASFLQVTFLGSDRLPQCVFKDDPLKCLACPHQDFSTWTKSALLQLLSDSKDDFLNSSRQWTAIYPKLIDAVERL